MKPKILCQSNKKNHSHLDSHDFGDSAKNDTVKTKSEIKIQVEAPLEIDQKIIRSNQNRQLSQNADQTYYYYKNRTPPYQQRLAGGCEPQNAARGPMFRQNDPGQAEHRDGADEIFTDAFNTVKIRNQFVQRVYMILSVQLFATFAFLLLETFQKDVKSFVLIHLPVFFFVGVGIFLAVYLALACSVNLRRKFPINFIFLGLLTVGLTMMLAPVVAVSAPVTVLSAVGTTAIVCLLVSIFACQTKWDITGCGLCLCVSLLVLIIYGIIIMILARLGFDVRILHVIYSAIAVLLFMFFLMYDTQVIVGGRRIELSPEEYIFGALNLYVDIMIIFAHILSLYNKI